MMDNISLHMRIKGVGISDNDVDSRSAATANLVTKWTKTRDRETILSLAAEIAKSLNGDGTPSEELGNEIQEAIQKKSSSYLYEESPLDVGICAGMAMVSMLSQDPSNLGNTNTDFYSTALWSALAFQPALEEKKREDLRQEVLNTARSWFIRSADLARERSKVPDPTALKIEVGDDDAITNNFKDTVSNTVNALRRNSALDREELDFLWWALLSRSRLLDKQTAKIIEPTRIIAAGIEGAKLLRRLPSEVHREIVLRSLDENPELDLTELIMVIGDDRTKLCAPINQYSDLIAEYTNVFPLLNALITGEAKSLGAEEKRPVSEWGERALIEAGFVQMILPPLVNL